MDRKDNVVTEEKDKEEENQRIRKALSDCDYPKWAMDKVQQQMKSNQHKTKKSNKQKDNPSRGMVVIPYVEGTAEKFQRICWKYRVSTAMRPTNTLNSLLVHPKDKRNLLDTSEVVYEVPCKGCNKSYVGETGRQLGVRLKEHQKTQKKLQTRNSLETREKLLLPSNTNQLSLTM